MARINDWLAMAKGIRKDGWNKRMVDLRYECLEIIIGVMIMLFKTRNGVPINFTSKLQYIYRNFQINNVLLTDWSFG